MKKYYTSIHSSLIFQLIRIYCGVLEEKIDSYLEEFDNEIELSKNDSSYEIYRLTVEKLKNYKYILEHEDEIDFRIIND